MMQASACWTAVGYGIGLIAATVSHGFNGVMVGLCIAEAFAIIGASYK
jgi:hypothetical protein